jgi:putative transposase
MQTREKKHRLPEGAYRGRKTISFTLCEDNRKRVFLDSTIQQVFKGFLIEAVEKYDCIVPAYCFMPDHLHVVTIGRSANSKGKVAIEEFKHRTGDWFAEFSASFHWQKDFHDHIVRHRDDRAAHVRYVLRNPVRAGLVENFMDYPGLGSIGVDLIEYLRDLDEDEKFGCGF